jgi:ATP-dependent DNA helicase RecG
MLLKNLRLVEGDYLKRAAMLLFHQDPENWFFGAYVKVGFFTSPADLLYHDDLHGPLISMADKVEDVVYTKYFKGIISYRGMQRIETFPVPRAAFREAVLNALIHGDHGAHNPIHIHIYPNEVLIYNSGGLPENWTADDLFARHASMPRNPLVAGAFFCSGQIEAWGRGIEKITSSCKEWGKPEPFYRIRPNEVMIGFKTGADAAEKILEKAGASAVQIKIIELMQSNPKISAKAIAGEVGIAPRNVQAHIRSLKAAGLVERVGAAKGGRWRVKSDGS